MNPWERNLLICYGLIISGIPVAIFGYYLVPGLSRVYPDSPFLFFVLPLIIIWILCFISFYYWRLVQREWFEYKQKPVKFWIWYIGGIVAGSLFLYLTLIDKERNEFEFAWVFSLLILIGIIFHSIYWILFWYDKLWCIVLNNHLIFYFSITDNLQNDLYEVFDYFLEMVVWIEKRSRWD